ncbi:MAG: hypothetical protein ACI865_002191 [Flavobacteriaceae bacterium]|jgi:hypothetical protein
MKYATLLIFSLFFALTTSAQTFSYSFEGNFDTESLLQLEQDCLSLKYVSSCKVKFKEDSHKGEVIVKAMSAKEKNEATESFSPIDLKRLLIQSGATPLEFIKLTD